jgi:hypothetical protein
VQRSRGLAEVPKTEKSSIVKEDTGGKYLEVREEELRKVFRKKTKIFAKSRRVVSFQIIN